MRPSTAMDFAKRQGTLGSRLFARGRGLLRFVQATPRLYKRTPGARSLWRPITRVGICVWKVSCPVPWDESTRSGSSSATGQLSVADSSIVSPGQGIEVTSDLMPSDTVAVMITLEPGAGRPSRPALGALWRRSHAHSLRRDRSELSTAGLRSPRAGVCRLYFEAAGWGGSRQCWVEPGRDTQEDRSRSERCHREPVSNHRGSGEGWLNSVRTLPGKNCGHTDSVGTQIEHRGFRKTD